MSSEFAKSTIFCTITPALLLSSFSVFSPCKQMVPDSNRAIKYSSLIYCGGKCLICIQRGGNMIFRGIWTVFAELHGYRAVCILCSNITLWFRIHQCNQISPWNTFSTFGTSFHHFQVPFGSKINKEILIFDNHSIDDILVGWAIKIHWFFV